MFKIGGEVVVIKNHSQGFVRKGQRFVVRDIMEVSCGHCIAIDIGLRENSSQYNPIAGCPKCSHKFFVGNVIWIDSKILKPVEDDFATQVLERILKEVKEEENLVEYLNIDFNKPIKIKII